MSGWERGGEGGGGGGEERSCDHKHTLKFFLCPIKCQFHYVPKMIHASMYDAITVINGIIWSIIKFEGALVTVNRHCKFGHDCSKNVVVIVFPK